MKIKNNKKGSTAPGTTLTWIPTLIIIIFFLFIFVVMVYSITKINGIMGTEFDYEKTETKYNLANTHNLISLLKKPYVQDYTAGRILGLGEALYERDENMNEATFGDIKKIFDGICKNYAFITKINKTYDEWIIQKVIIDNKELSWMHIKSSKVAPEKTLDNPTKKAKIHIKENNEILEIEFYTEKRC